MERNQAIGILNANVDLSALANAVAAKAVEQPNNWLVQMNTPLFAAMATDPGKSWFTGFGALVTNQRNLAAEVLQLARASSSQPPLTTSELTIVLNAVCTGAKITKADAGRALDATV